MFPTFPSKAGQEKRRKMLTPDAPKREKVGEGGETNASVMREMIDLRRLGGLGGREDEEKGGGFALKLI